MLLICLFSTGCSGSGGGGASLVSTCNTSSIAGSGVQGDPYIFCNESQLLTLSGAVSSGVFYRLGADITLDAQFTPITGFLGDFDGGSHTITGLLLYAPTSDNQGFFDSLDQGASVHDVVFDGAKIAADSYAGVVAGAIGLNLQSKVILKNITVKNSFVVSNQFSGGIAGDLELVDLTNTTVENTSVGGLKYVGLLGGGVEGTVNIFGGALQGTLSGGSYVGGVFGYAQNAVIQKLAVDATISVPPSSPEVVQNYFGLLSGHLSAVSVDSSSVVGLLVNEAANVAYAGQLAGSAQNCTITHSVFAASNFSDPVSGLSSSAGLVGQDGGGNTVASSVYFFTQADTLTETKYPFLVQLTQSQMIVEANFPGLDFVNTWQMGQNSAFQFPVLQTQMIGVPYNASPNGAVWISETAVTDGHTFQPTFSANTTFALLTLHNDSGAAISIESFSLAMNDVFQLASNGNAGTCTPGVLNNTATCTIGVQFSPYNVLSGHNVIRDLLLFTYQSAGISETISHAVDAIGEFNAPLIADDTVHLADTIQGQSSIYHYNFINSGGLTGQIVSYSYTGSGDITIDESACAPTTNMAPTTSCTLTFHFSPTTTNAYVSHLTIIYQDPNTSYNKTAMITINANGIVHPFKDNPALACQSADGSSGNPFCIYDLTELQKVGSFVTKSFILTQDLDLSSLACNAFAPIANYSGVFDGQNFVISNFCWNDTTKSNVAFFANVTGPSAGIKNLVLTNFNVSGSDQVGALIGTLAGGTIQNITINNATVQSQSTSNQTDFSGVGTLVGLIAGTDTVTISNVASSGSVTALHWNSGGLIGNLDHAAATISSSSSSATVSGGTFIGGFVGFSQAGTIDSSSASGVVTSASCGGGFAGGTTQVAIDGSSSTGAITGSSANGGIGGFVGCVQGGSNFTNSFSSGSVTASTGVSIGGFIGASYGAEQVDHCYSLSTVSGGQDVGGFIGGGNGGGPSAASIQDSFYAGTSVSGVTTVGGFAGNTGGIILESFSANASVAASTNFAGGFAGTNSGIISNAYTLASTITSAGTKNGFTTANTGTITHGFFNSNSGLTDANASGLAAAAMATQGNFTGFTFTTSSSATGWVMPTANTHDSVLSPVPAGVCAVAGTGITCP